MNLLLEAGTEIQRFMRKRDWHFCFIGGLAVIRWGEMRMTQDVDLCILSEFGTEERYIDSFLTAFKPRISDAADFALINRVLLLSASNGIDIDLSFAGLPFEQQMIERASSFSFCKDCEPLITCSAEDLIILKAFADRMKDWADIEGILVRHRQHLDLDYVIKQLTPLCELKEEPDIIKKIHKLIQSSSIKTRHGNKEVIL